MKPWTSALDTCTRAFRLLSQGFLVLRPSRTHRRSRFTPAFLLAFALTSCTRHEPPADLVILNGGEPESLDPAIISGQLDGRVVQSLFEGLMRFDPVTAKPIPGLAERVEVSPEGKVYTFYLRSNALWSTGEPVTSEDVVFSWQRLLDPATAGDYAGNLYYIKNAEEFNTGRTNPLTGKKVIASDVAVKALDPRTVQVELVNPTPFFLDLCAFHTGSITQKKVVEKYGDRWLNVRPLPCNGAYTLDYWRIHDKIRIRRNPLYWDNASTQNEIVDFLPVDSSTTAMNIFQTGGANILWDKNLVPTELLDALLPRAECHTFPMLASYFYRYNVTKPPFNDVRVRKALAMAIDKKRLVQKISKAGEQVTTHVTPKGIAGYAPPEGVGYDPERARQLLKEAGFPGGQGFPPFKYLFNTAELHKQIAVEMQEMWQRELGIKMELRQTEWKVYLAAQSKLDYDLSRSSWVGDYNDPNTFLDMFMSENGNNRTGWKSPRYDDLMRQANQQADQKKRALLLREAETLLVREDLPIVPLYLYVGVNFYDPQKIDGVYLNILDVHPVNAIRNKGRRSIVDGR